MKAFLVGLTLISIPVTATAQNTATVVENAPVYVTNTPSANQTPLRVAAVGTVFKVVGQEGDWFQVEFNDPRWGRRQGWVHKKFVNYVDEALRPMDLTVREATPAPAPQSAPAAPSRQVRPAPTPVLQESSRVWIEVNFGVAFPHESTLTTSGSYDYFDEVATETASYDFSRGAEFDFGGGVMITPSFGLGVAFAGTAHKDPVGLSANIPHPLYPDAYASDSSETNDELKRTEGSINMLAVYQKDIDDHSRFRIFGGPTYFRLKADAVTEVLWDQQFGIFTRNNVVSITGYRGREVEETGWGFNVGADYSYFLTRVFGLGFMGRYNLGQVTFREDPAAVIPSGDVDVKVGGFQFGGGLRLRF